MINAYLRHMQLFNVTAIVEEPVAPAFEAWLAKTHFPVVKASGLFDSERLLRVLNPQHEGTTYCIQFIADGETAVSRYKQEFFPALQHKAQQDYAGRLFLIETQMESINLDAQ